MGQVDDDIYESWHIYIVARLLKLQVLMLSFVNRQKGAIFAILPLRLHRTIRSHVVFRL